MEPGLFDTGFFESSVMGGGGLHDDHFTDLAEIWYLEVFWGACFRYQVRFYFWKLLKFCYKDIHKTITSENLEYSLTNWLLW